MVSNQPVPGPVRTEYQGTSFRPGLTPPGNPLFRAGGIARMVANQPVPGAVMTVYQGTSFTPELTPAGDALFRAGVKVSAGTCDDLAASLRRRHQRNGTRWRLLDPLAQAVLVIAFLRTNLTYAELAAGFGISPATCWRDVAGGISVLADRGRRISLRDVGRLAVRMGWDYLLVDGTHVPAVTFGRKTGGQRAFYSGKHKRHGLNVQEKLPIAAVMSLDPNA